MLRSLDSRGAWGALAVGIACGLVLGCSGGSEPEVRWRELEPRLQQRVWRSDEGPEIVEHDGFFDTERQEWCHFLPAEDGLWRCFPGHVFDGSLTLFADADCRDAIYPVDEDHSLLLWSEFGCGVVQ
ncbi:MAG TPA: hypothetical protein VLC09_15770, partial [Polyangiaceae bacterium]|nr:hypothetical protein [Polyangiaceae bacterium]